MEHLNSVRAALRASAPVIAIPVPGHAPVCIRAKLLKGTLKGVTIDSVEITETRWLKIKGHAGNVHTSCSFTPISRYDALKAISDWSYRERKKRKVIALQGVLSADDEIVDVPEPQQDQLGLGIVLYWPYYEWPKDHD